MNDFQEASPLPSFRVWNCGQCLHSWVRSVIRVLQAEGWKEILPGGCPKCGALVIYANPPDQGQGVAQEKEKNK